MNLLLQAIFKFCTTKRLFKYFRQRYSDQHLKCFKESLLWSLSRSSQPISFVKPYFFLIVWPSAYALLGGTRSRSTWAFRRVSRHREPSVRELHKEVEWIGQWRTTWSSRGHSRSIASLGLITNFMLTECNRSRLMSLKFPFALILALSIITLWRYLRNNEW